MKAVAVLVAAGSGERLGADRPKAFVVLAGRPMLEWSLEALAAAGITAGVVAPPPGAGTAAPRAVAAPPPPGRPGPPPRPPAPRAGGGPRRRRRRGGRSHPLGVREGG